jgi:hypothetical protein
MASITNNKVSSISPATQNLVLKGKNVIIEGENGTLTFTGDPISGGSAYPDNTFVPTSSLTLDASQQGWILPGSNGITITLPSNPAVGETYKFLHGGFDCTIDANGVTIINYPNNTLALRAGMIVHFLAGSYLGNPIWMISYPEMSKAWSADVRYIAGDVVSYNGNVYIAKATTTGDQPDISPTVWVNPSFGGGHVIQDEGSPLAQRSALDFVGAGVTVTDDPVNDKTIVSISSGGGGGGSPYPDHVTIITAPTTLTPAHQGIVYCMGVKVTLPASAPDGTTYKLIGSPGDVIIDTNGAPIAGLGAGTDIKPGDPVITLVALNAPNLIWGIANKKAAHNYYSDRTYLYGDIVQDSGNYYLSISDQNLGNPLTDTTKWRRIGGGSIYVSGILNLSNAIGILSS